MSSILCVTERDLKGLNPLFPSSGLMDQFILLNMGTEIWLADKQHSKFPEMLDAAIETAFAYEDRATWDKLNTLKLERSKENG